MRKQLLFLCAYAVQVACAWELPALQYFGIIFSASALYLIGTLPYSWGSR